MPDIVAHILNANSFAYFIAGVMAVASGVLMNLLTGSLVLTWCAAPFAWFGALAGVYAFDMAGIMILPQREPNTILTACVGAVVATFAVIVVAKAVYRLGDLKKPVVKDGPILQ